MMIFKKTPWFFCVSTCQNLYHRRQGKMSWLMSVRSCFWCKNLPFSSHHFSSVDQKGYRRYHWGRHFGSSRGKESTKLAANARSFSDDQLDVFFSVGTSTGRILALINFKAFHYGWPFIPPNNHPISTPNFSSDQLEPKKNFCPTDHRKKLAVFSIILETPNELLSRVVWE